MIYWLKGPRLFWLRFMAADVQHPSVMVTRPAGAAADGLCRAVEQSGFKAYSQPLLELLGLASLAPEHQQMVAALDAYQHVIFVSTNAVQFGMQEVQQTWPQLPASIHWYAIGSVTGKFLQSYDIRAITPGRNMSSEGLLRVESLQEVSGHRVLIVKGIGGRDTMALELRRRGANVDELACYRRGRPALEAGELANKLTQWGITVVLISSGEGLTNLRLLLSPAETSNFKHLCIIVPSSRVAQMARDSGFDTIITAKNASDAAMLSALEEWKSSSGG